MFKEKKFFVILTVCLSFLLATCSMPGNDATDDSSSSSQEEKTFTTGITSVSNKTIDQLCGLVVPEDWERTVTFEPESALTTRATLPSAFDWRDSDDVSPIRNQGSCGSCWAFGTIGVFESAVRINKGVSHDYSEQYLVSCNSSGWGCDGGWFAYGYLQDGAVKESCYPYTATDSSCKSGCTKYYGVSAAYYVGSSASVPTTTAIKTAIYNYGPVAAAVYVDTNFQNYTGGVFNGTASGTCNHAIILVGWDDSDGCWILRNSWGTGWGENGYMRIKYGSQQVGYAANYMILD